jgi:hypothetical protein
VKTVAQGPHGELLRRVEILYTKTEEEFDNEPLTPEDLAAMQAGEEAVKRGEYVTLEELKKELEL